MDPWDYMRWVNVALSAGVAALLIAGAVAKWPEMPRWLKRIVPWVVVTYLLLAYGSGEVAVSEDHIQPGLRVALLTLNLTGLLGAIIALRFVEHDD